MKKAIRVILTGFIISTMLMSTVLGAQVKKSIEVVYNSVNMTVNGSKVNADNILFNGTTYAPIRAVAEALGKNVGWDKETFTASVNDKGLDSITKDIKPIRVDTITGKKTIEVVYNSVNLTVNGSKINADNILYNGTTYIPIRVVAEALGKYVGWDQNLFTASINDKEDKLVRVDTIEVKEKESIYLEDALNLISVIEDTHPAFSLGDISDKYEQEKQQFINSINNNTTMNEFTYLVRRYLTLLQDSHTRVEVNAITGFLDLVYQSKGDEMYLSTKDGILLKDKVLKIGGVSINEIYKTVKIYYATENEVAKDLNNNRYASSYEILKLAGCAIDNGTVDVTIDQNGILSDKKIKFGGFVNEHIYPNDQNTVEIESRMIDDIFYIDMDVCNDNSILDNQIVKLKEAIQKGTTKIIIDVRNNPGGTSNACYKLLKACGMEVPTIGQYIRYSELTKDLGYGYPSEGFEQFDPDKTSASINENIELVVLMNEWTYSSATILTTWVQDGNLGTIIGIPCANAPSTYGSILYYKLPNTKIQLAISFKRFLRPDTKANQNILIPDIITDYNTDSLETAIKYLNKK